ncbi:equilibrative nucleobase transporter 1-like isoform X2 [Hydra vulgaris]|uniref:Equilibrative nucleobase transporter 1-like isoform X2 n=1 Tax=Hydra vulgaris TaxID=6087 RepID=A0ABM4CVU2_HYDVU
MSFFNWNGKFYSIILFVSVLLVVLVCGGIVFGWASIVVIFKAKNYYFDLCTIFYKNNNVSLTNSFSSKANESVFSVNSPFHCLKQDDKLNLVFTIASSFVSISQLPIGLFLDRFGARVAMTLGGSVTFFISLFLVGCMGLAFIIKGNENFLFPSFIAIGVGGIVLYLSILQISNIILWRRKAIIICSISGGFDSSAIVLLFFKLIYDAGIKLSYILYIYSGLSLLLITFVIVFFIPSQNKLNKWSLEEKSHNNNSINGCVTLNPKISSNINHAFERYESFSNVSTPSSEPKFENQTADARKLSSIVSTRLSTLKTQNMKSSVIQSIITPLYMIEVACLLNINLKYQSYVGFLQPNLERLTKNNLSEVSKYINIFGYLQLCGVLFTPFIGLTFKRLKKTEMQNLNEKEIYVSGLRSSIAPYCILNFLAMLFCVFDLINSMKLQIPTYILCATVRGVLYANHATFIGIAFPSSQFGTLFGLSTFLAGVFGLLQYALFYLTNHVFDGTPFWSNLIQLLLVSLGNAYPIYVWFYSRKKEITSSTNEPPHHQNQTISSTN